jgi:glycosyltransferase involved in cell wall biosynthesis
MSTRLKILVLTNLFPTPWDPLRSAFNLQQFERLGALHDVEVLTAVDFRERLRGTRGTVDVANLRTNYFTFVYPPRIGRTLHAMCWFACLLLQHGRRLRSTRYDCILASWGYPDAVAAGWLARMLGIPYVVKLHGSDINVQANHAARRWQIRGALQKAAAVITVSRALASKAIAIGADRLRTHTLYNGVDGDRFKPGARTAARRRLELVEGSPRLLFVGNLKRAKGCMDLLEAFPALLAVKPNARLAYVGTGPCMSELIERATALGCAQQIDLIGSVTHVALGDWFRAADLLCLPSHNEGVPNVVLEAMSCGTPIVATRVGGIPEVVPAVAGLLVPPQDRKSLQDALIEASERQWNTAAIVAHASRFRWDDNVQRLDRILQAAVEGHSSRLGINE